MTEQEFMEIVEIVQGVARAFNDHDVDRFLSYRSDDVVFRDTGMPEPIRGKRAFGQLISRRWSAFPDIKVTVEDLVVGCDCAAVQLRFTGTHQGEMATPLGTIQPTGRRVEFPACTLIRIADGKIREQTTYQDYVGLMEQLGALSLLARAA